MANLPRITFGSLLASVGFTGKRDMYRIGYETTAQLVRGAELGGGSDDHIVIRHHGSVIAEVARDWVYLTTAGWDSSTTVARLEAVMRDNGINAGFTGYSVAIREGDTWVIDREHLGSKSGRIMRLTSAGVTFDRVAGSWVIREQVAA